MESVLSIQELILIIRKNYGHFQKLIGIYVQKILIVINKTIFGIMIIRIMVVYIQQIKTFQNKNKSISFILYITIIQMRILLNKWNLMDI